ncbi:Alpha/beta hydrolase fold-1 [Aspergillus minisclerotigenes]|uniref:Alpha/beta hydrolase fold-1 n=1 Tax=Aspergillus minisclerotigenes TaxID=656917 RepID=A0A5N6IY31_9EURO|nr:Alpha/beta hydrolase fold-1 [Aspergillus minisclerotigenes]
MTVTTTTRPTILVIHGAWHHPEFYAPFCRAFEDLGYEAVCPRLLTCNNDVPPTKTLADDVALIRQTAQSLIDDGKSVVAVMHSYGGIVGTDALDGLAIKRLIYMTAFIPPSGNSLAGMFGGQVPPFITIDDEKGMLTVPDPATFFFNDLPSEEAAAWAKKLVVHPKSAQFDPISNEAYRSIPATYIVCEQDAALIPMVQEMMIENVRKAGVDIDVERLPASHSPFLSMPEETAKLVLKIASQ